MMPAHNWCALAGALADAQVPISPHPVVSRPALMINQRREFCATVARVSAMVMVPGLRANACVWICTRDANGVVPDRALGHAPGSSSLHGDAGSRTSCFLFPLLSLSRGTGAARPAARAMVFGKCIWFFDSEPKGVQASAVARGRAPRGCCEAVPDSSAVARATPGRTAGETCPACSTTATGSHPVAFAAALHPICHRAALEAES